MFLAYALWAVALLSAVALSLLATGNTSHHLSRNALTVTHHNAAVEAAVARAVLGILDARPGQRWRVDGAAQPFSFADISMQVAIQDELGRIDLNHADQALLSGLFQSAGLGHTAAAVLVDKVLDWRDPLPGKRVHGAIDADYRAVGRAYRPRGGPFQSVDELKLVLGITPPLYERLAPALTVYSGRPLLDPQFAPRQALAAVRAINPAAAASADTARRHQGAREGIIDPTLSLRGRAFSINVQVKDRESQFAREVVVRLTDNASEPYWVLNWGIK